MCLIRRLPLEAQPRLRMEAAHPSHITIGISFLESGHIPLSGSVLASPPTQYSAFKRLAEP